ncbi:hypothetical protein [Zoogloea sp.]|uniref:hypothetical protein n=1 Tax=Zoogloea sp. TaxID=49181 RepID=UPI00321FE0BC
MEARIRRAQFSEMRPPLDLWPLKLLSEQSPPTNALPHLAIMTSGCPKAIEQADLAQLCDAGAVRELHILEREGQVYELQAIDQRGTSRVLVVKRSVVPRRFKTADAAIAVVKSFQAVNASVTLHLLRASA